MRMLHCFTLVGLMLTSTPLVGQGTEHKPSYIVPSQVNYAALIPEPPRAGSAAAKEEMTAVLLVQKHRTAAGIAAARKDADEEDIFIFADVMGPDFQAGKLPLTAAFSAKLRNESAVINPGLKQHFNRPRPFMVNANVHKVCDQKPDNGYPSGHSMVGWLTGLSLAEMVPERSQAILLRAHSYAMNRVVCGVHYPSDTEASHIIALAMYGNMAASPAFQNDMAASRAEIRKILNLPTVATK